MAAFAEQHGISFPLLADPDSETIKRFELLNPVPEWAFSDDSDNPSVQADIETYVSLFNPAEMMIGMAFPGTFMLDANGAVTSRFFEDFYLERNTVSSIVMRLGSELEPAIEAVRLSTAQVDITTYLSEPTLAIGNRFALMIKVEPHAGMHVYAPGADYRVIALEMEPQSHVKVLPLTYPESTTYYFEPFDENVPVYESAFDLVQNLVVDGSREALAALRDQENLTFNGRLLYQACSETICYPPQTVPLSWTVPLRPLIFQRPGQ